MRRASLLPVPFLLPNLCSSTSSVCKCSLPNQHLGQFATWSMSRSGSSKPAGSSASTSASLSNVVSSLVRAQHGLTAREGLESETDLDRHVADLLLKDAKAREERAAREKASYWRLSDDEGWAARLLWLACAGKPADTHLPSGNLTTTKGAAVSVKDKQALPQEHAPQS